MGLADLVPGVSGATVATLTGIYPRVLQGVARPRLSDWRLWLPLLVGMATAFIVGAHGVTWLLQHRIGRRAVLGLFALLVVWAIIVCARLVRPWTPRGFVLAAVGIGVGLIGSVAMPQLGTGAGSTCLMGVVAAFAFVLPGLSGAAVIHLCGHYERALLAVTEGNWSVIGPLALGMVAGIALFARIAHHLHGRWPRLTMAFFTGCMIGALPLLR